MAGIVKTITMKR